MLLRVIGVAPLTRGALVVAEDYVPIAFRTYEDVLPAPFTWQAVGADRLLEITIDRDTMAISGIKVVLDPSIAVGSDALGSATVDEVSGLPVVSGGGFTQPDWGHPFHAHPCDFEAGVSGRDVFVVFAAGRAPERLYRADRVGVFEEGGEVVAVGFFGLSDADLAGINAALAAWRGKAAP